MNGEPVQLDVRTVWQKQEVATRPLSLDQIRKKARQFQWNIRWRNRVEYLAAAVVVVFSGYFFWIVDDVLVRTGMALLVAGTLYMVYQLHMRGSVQMLPSEPALRPCLEFLRAELVRQRDLLRDVWRWYLLPFAPGMIMIFVAASGRMLWTQWVGKLALLSVFFWSVAMLNRWAARRLQREIDALDKES